MALLMDRANRLSGSLRKGHLSRKAHRQEVLLPPVSRATPQDENKGSQVDPKNDKPNEIYTEKVS